MAEPVCPICKRHSAMPAFRPFCSRRCADVDLGRWITGHYVVEGDEGDAAGDEAAGDEPA